MSPVALCDLPFCLLVRVGRGLHFYKQNCNILSINYANLILRFSGTSICVRSGTILKSSLRVMFSNSFCILHLVSILVLNHVALHLSIVPVLKPEFVFSTY